MTHDVVIQFRARLASALEWAGPDVTDSVLRHIAPIPFRGDVDGYLAEVISAAAVAFRAAMQPTLDALSGESARLGAEADAIEAQFRKTQQEFEEFRRMQTPPTIQ